jgi:hypothetical protein
MGGTIEVLPASSTLEHRSTGSTLVWIDAASIRKPVADSTGRIRVSVANAWVEPVMVQLVCSLSAAGLAPPVARGSHSAGTSTARADVNLAGARLTTVDLTIPRLPSAGRYVLTIVARLEQATSSVAVDSIRVVPQVVVRA